jgi:hypothetical protein
MIRLLPARQALLDWLPPLAAGALAWLAFVLIGDTPILRAAGLAAAVIGVALALRPMGAALCAIGALAFAFSASFWAQMGGADSLSTAPAVAGAAALLLIGALVVGRSRWTWALVIGVVLFVCVFFWLNGAPRSLRLTTLFTAWLLFLLVEALIVTDIRPDAVLMTGRKPFLHDHALPLLLVLALGVFNDPLFALLTPALLIGVWLTRRRLRPLMWAAFIGLSLYGAYGIMQSYVSSVWWGIPAEQVGALRAHVPFLIADGWRDPQRWLMLFDLVIRQFTLLGVILGVIGLARLSRWHPPLGTVTMLAYAAYALFGLMYFGEDAATLLLPLLMIQVVWMTYAVYTFGQWLQKSLAQSERRGEWVLWFAPAAFVLLPLLLLLRIIGVL